MPCITEKGRDFPLPYFFNMPTIKIREALERIIEEVDPSVFIVGIDLKKGRRSILSIKIDTDEGITLDTCTRISRKLNRWIDEEQPLGDSSLLVELSSPGVGYPLKLARQYPRNVGRVLEISDAAGERILGLLISVNGEEIQIDTRVTSLKGQKKSPSKASKKPAKDSLGETIQTFRIEDIIQAKVKID